jgi:two-component system, OmpR family, sensor histidine kinase PhoQ
LASGSLSRRLLVSITVPLVLFFGVTVFVLEARFRATAEASMRELLDAQIYALIASAELDGEGHVQIGRDDSESRLQTPGSGLYARIQERDGHELWRSASTAGSFIDFGTALAPGQRGFRYFSAPRAGRLAAISLGIAWEEGRRPQDLTFTVAMSLAPYDEQLRLFRRTLYAGVAGGTVLLLVTLALLLRWVLRPLRQLEAQIHEVEDGKRESLDARWPDELSGVAGNLNTLLHSERNRIARYRDTLGNLAHSLKTPLSVLRASLASGDPANIAQAVDGQVDRMNGIIEHQLRRAAASGGATLGQSAVEVAPVAAELRSALLKAHGRKDFTIELTIGATARFVGDRGDLLESLGNLMENACKWCREKVRVGASFDADAPAAEQLCITVEDDGAGIAPRDRDRVLRRGERADEQVAGHGLGLAMVRDMAEAYGGRLEIAQSALGGASLLLRLPGRD